ncbi:MAG: rhomboid family intramembrane serine protease [Anaerococcus sp.]|jgi:rhomboid family protein|uniref:rhomboid family intramembrane serine protease n=1 Tax=Anaerococcus TaxID=165779 RepID=UPI0023544830|nr:MULTISPECIES: rhomboid family intramembrane serine protease [Anaerococcus]MDU4025750.1 rhomboid family intramembrane serine protease [Anaerococcus sp.]MDU5534590.1 rhomboid family intramembrane serine protease [Anaerococcus sp.]MDU7412164.1 rhomboid family intramembrane serine protease [Anaerococcus sp.]
MNNLRNLGSSRVTSILLVVNILVFAIMTLAGGSQNISNLVRFGAVVKDRIAYGEWWRLFTASFIHIGFMHILLNMYFLYQIGPVFEKLYGSRNFLIIYLLAGIMGNLLTFAFGSSSTVSAGASTSLYGLFGLAIGIMLNYKGDSMLSSFGASFLSVIAINIVYSLINPSIGLLGHLGGLLAGVILAGIFPVINRSLPTSTQVISASAYIILAILFVRIGLKTVV